MRHQKGADVESSASINKFKFIANPLHRVSDSYGDLRDPFTKRPIYPATSHISLLFDDGGHPDTEFRVKWLVGNMPRKAMDCSTWSDRAMIGFEREQSTAFDSAMWERKRIERERVEKEKKAAQEKAVWEAREAELAVIRREAKES